MSDVATMDRKACAAEIKRMADLANDKSHDWTDDDEQRWNATCKRHDALAAQFDDNRRAGTENRVGWDGLGQNPNVRQANGPTEFYKDTRSGRKVPVFRGDQRMADYAGRSLSCEELDERYGEFSIGDAMRALYTGCETDQERRALSEGSDGAGGFTVPTVLSAQMIDLMRTKARVFQAGAASITLESDRHDFAKLASDPVAGWRGELASVADSDPTFEQVSFQPKSLAVLVRVSEELLQDSVNVAQALTSSMSNALALEVDRVALLGSGSSNQPAGLANMSGVQSISMGTNGAAVTDYTPILDAVEDLQEANAGDVTAAIMAPRTLRQFNGLTDTTGQPLRRPVSIEGLPMLETTQVPTDETQGTADDASSIFLGNFAELVVGFRQQLRIEILRERFRDTLEVGYLAHMRVDVQAWHEAGLAKIVGVVPSS